MGFSRSARQISRRSPVCGRPLGFLRSACRRVFYVNVEPDRPQAAKYGLTIADVQQAVASGIGGMNVAENIEGRERYTMNVRYNRDFRDQRGRSRPGADRYAIGRSNPASGCRPHLVFARPCNDPR